MNQHDHTLTLKLFWSGRLQAVRLLKEFRFEVVRCAFDGRVMPRPRNLVRGLLLGTRGLLEFERALGLHSTGCL